MAFSLCLNQRRLLVCGFLGHIHDLYPKHHRRSYASSAAPKTPPKTNKKKKSNPWFRKHETAEESVPIRFTNAHPEASDIYPKKQPGKVIRASYSDAPPDTTYRNDPFGELFLPPLSTPNRDARTEPPPAQNDSPPAPTSPPPAPANASPILPNPSLASTPKLTHLDPTSAAHMVSVATKPATHRTAIAVARVRFSNPHPHALITSNSNKKGDVAAVARIAGIMAAKKTPDLIPLAHPLSISKVGVTLRVVAPSSQLHHRNNNANESVVDENRLVGKKQETQGDEDELEFGGMAIEARVECVGPTGVEMEALCAAAAAGLTVYDMCKAVDKGMVVEGVRVVLKEGGKSGKWREEGWRGMEGE